METEQQTTLLHVIRTVLAEGPTTIGKLVEQITRPQQGVTFSTTKLEVHRACRELERRGIVVMTTKSNEIIDLDNEGWRLADPLAARVAVLQDAKPRKPRTPRKAKPRKKGRR